MAAKKPSLTDKTKAYADSISARTKAYAARLRDKTTADIAKHGWTDSTRIVRGEVPIEGRELVALGKAGIALAKNPKAIAQFAKTIRNSVTSGKMSLDELAAWAKKTGLSMQQVVKAEKSAASTFGRPYAGGVGRRTAGYAADAAESRAASASRWSVKPPNYERRPAQKWVESAKKRGGKQYDIAKGASEQSAQLPSGSARQPDIATKAYLEVTKLAKKLGVNNLELQSAFKAAAMRGTLPAAAAAAASRKNEEPRQGYKYGGMVPKGRRKAK